MSTEDHIWSLAANRLADKATEEELRELDALLKKYSDTDPGLKIIADWWHEDSQEDIVRRGAFIFEKIKEKIKANEDQSNRVKTRRPE